MTSMRKLRRRALLWQRYAAKVNNQLGDRWREGAWRNMSGLDRALVDVAYERFRRERVPARQMTAAGDDLCERCGEPDCYGDCWEDPIDDPRDIETIDTGGLL